MSQLLTFRVATRDDAPQILALFNEAFRTQTDSGTWEWYAHGNPYGASRVYLALDQEDHNAAGAFVCTPLRLTINGAPVQASSAHHLVLKPAYQGGPAFVGLSRHTLEGESREGMKLVIGVPNSKSYRPHKVLMKWTDFGAMDMLFKLSPQQRPHSCVEAPSFSEDEFHRRVGRTLNFCLEKTAEWLNWRFCRRPGNPYTIYDIRDGGELAGYVVLKRWQDADGYRKAHIMDLHALNPAALSQLIAAAESYAVGANELNLWAMCGYPYRAALETMGFVPRPSSRQPLIARVFDASIEFPAGNASLTYGDPDYQY